MAELPHIGKHCGVDLCNRLDFLPVKCDSCSQSFCVEHFSYDAHDCENAYRKNVQVPVCPMCSQPVPTPKGVAPDVHVDEHIQNNCSAYQKKRIFKNKCTMDGCKKKELVPITCSSCQQNFCLRHRHEKDHECEGAVRRGQSKAAQAAIARSQTCSSAARKQQVSSDAEMAKALAASLSDTHLSPEERDRRLAEQLQQEEYSNGQTVRTRNSDRCSIC